MTNNAPDYQDNLAFDPTSGTAKSYTDRTELTIKLIDQVEKLTKQLEIAVNALNLIRKGEQTIKDANNAVHYIESYVLQQIKELEK